MPNPYAQVALTYVRRPFGTWQGRMLCACLLFFSAIYALSTRWIWHVPNNSMASLGWLMPMFVLVGSAFFLVAAHAKEQFADSRAHLMPGFRYTHGLIGAAAALLVAVVLPAIITLVMGWQSVGLTAISVLGFGTVLWLMLACSAWISLFVVAAWLASVTEPGGKYLQELVTGQSEGQAVALLIVGLIVAIRGGVRLIRLNEDMPEYHTRIKWDPSARSHMSRQAWSGEGRILSRLWDWLTERQMASLTQHAGRAPSSRWSRICRWRIGMCTGWSVWLWAFGMIAYVAILDHFFFTNGGKIDNKPPSVFMFSFMATFFPVLGGMGRWIVRCRSLGRELMLPVDRVAYVRQLGLAAAVSQFQLWCAIVIAAIVWWQTLATPSPGFDAVALMLAVSGLCQFWTFGMSAWFARYRSQGLFTLGMISALMPAQMLAGFANGSPFLLWALPAAGVLAMLGLLVAWDAYRRWLRADFD